MGKLMKHIIIRNKNNGLTIHEGYYNSDKDCIEDAVAQNIDLSHADLSYKNLSCANIDTAQLFCADLRHCNLSNANISESHLDNANMEDTNLVGACLAETSLKNASMINASFGATDMTYATIDACKFNTLSALHLDFSTVKSMQGCAFYTIEKDIHVFSAPPITISGLPQGNIYIIDNKALLGHTRFIEIAQNEWSQQALLLSILQKQNSKI
ncbi:MAG: hypothetical protein CMH27_02290 [Micavibrio sp.]|nr:hypothetical protein [Micavibrio sp.]